MPESVVRAVGDSIDQIERDPDARRAIIRAYAQMEHAFDDAGIPRRPYEAPFEYLGRALRGLRVSPPAAGRLAALFERARFSQHVVGAETKHEAIGALREVERADAGAVTVSRTAVHAIALGAFAAVGSRGGRARLARRARAHRRDLPVRDRRPGACCSRARVANALPRAEPVPLEQPPRSQRVGQLESVARALDLAEASSFDLHNILRPIVREIAAARLARHGVSLDRQPERARALLGPQAWELVRPDREAPAGRSGRGGCSRDELRAIVDSLEAI